MSPFKFLGSPVVTQYYDSCHCLLFLTNSAFLLLSRVDFDEWRENAISFQPRWKKNSTESNSLFSLFQDGLFPRELIRVGEAFPSHSIGGRPSVFGLQHHCTDDDC